MRFRIFGILLLSGFLITAITTAIYLRYLEAQRIDSIDQQLRDAATSLIEANFGRGRTINSKKAEEIISYELGPSRIGKVFIVKNEEGEIIFQSETVNTLKIELPEEPQWVSIVKGDSFIRVLNLNLPRVPDRTLQVGLVESRSVLTSNHVGRKAVFYGFLSLLFVLVLSLGLTVLILKPFRELNAYVLGSSNFSSLRDLPPLPKKFEKFIKERRFPDEFSTLVKAIQKQVERINSSSQVLRVWATRMAHELKTPLTIMRMEAEEELRSKAQEHSHMRIVLEELQDVDRLISDFLTWTEFENAPAHMDLHSLSLKDAISKIVRRMERLSPGRIVVDVLEDARIFTTPLHIEMVLQNLLNNALKYSPVTEVVKIEVRGNRIEVIDRGPGLPPEVKANLGRPFNRSEQGTDIKSSGLGLAIVLSILKIYGWELQFARNGVETRAILETK